MTGVLLMAHGTPSSLDEMPEYLRLVRGGRPPSEVLIAEMRHNYQAIGGRSPLTAITLDQAAALQRRLGPDMPVAVGMLQQMVREMPGWRPRGHNGNGITAMFVGGRSTAMPHGFVKGHGIQKGDVLVSGAGADIDGYHSELERTMIVGDPSPEQERAFAAMLALQTRAIEIMAPGVTAGEVELATVALAEELGVQDRLRHHVGHSIGLEGHEAPFHHRRRPPRHD